jgi:uncharacterized protein YjbI with pentapeptide repeats
VSADLTAADLPFADLERAAFGGANLEDADLTVAFLKGACGR